MPERIRWLSLELLEQLPVGIVVWQLEHADDDCSLRLLYANPAASRFTHVDLSARAGRPILEVFPKIPADWLHSFADVCRGRESLEMEDVVYGDDNVPQSSFSITAIPVLDAAVAIVFENLSPLKQAENEARRLGHFLDSIIEGLPAMVFMKDARTLRFERFNRAGEELLGIPREELLGKSDYDFFPREQADFFVAKDREVLEHMTVRDIPQEPVDTPRGTRWLHTRKIPILGSDGRPQYLLGVSLDITDRKRAEEALRQSHGALERSVVQKSAELEREIEERERAEHALVKMEEQLRQSQRLESIGRLAGGISHDFNNILCVVLGYCDSVLAQLREDDPLRGEVDEVRRAGQKAADLTRQLLAFSRQQVLKLEVVDLNAILHGLERMLPRLLGEDIRLHVRTLPGAALIKADPSQIEQVVMNLVVNARDAMPTGGQLNIETAAVDLDREFVATHLGAQHGPHVMLAVSDTGEGMDRETLTHMFEPFFTTKEHGKGTGLGLSTVFGIVKQSGGSIFPYSEPRQGTTIKIFFPATADVPAAAVESTAPGNLRGTETVLLVEDDESLRHLTAAILRRYGYAVIACERASEALTMVDAHGRIDLLLTDVVMPDLSGRLLAERVRARRPGIKVLFMSGYTDDAVVRHGVLESSMAFLQKPFTAGVLARRVREVLEAPARSEAGARG